MHKLVVLTGAGMSAESGIKTFRDAGGLWEGHDVTEVASPEGWLRNPEKVLKFYNQRRKNVTKSLPNQGHRILAELEQYLDLQIITQNIDDLHERAGSSKVLHLHGEIDKCESTLDASYIIPVKGNELNLGDVCPRGGQLRPHIVWFGEAVPMLELALELVLGAEMVLVIGTSMEVYPAASLTQYVHGKVPIFLIDPNPNHQGASGFTHIVAGASEGMLQFKNVLKQKEWL